ncbi:MAG: hypothetical protein JST00_20090 [Deltaproteobacteria bacterium]|nr:hypothetical protein [Deltaproteobacteria bacterium]
MRRNGLHAVPIACRCRNSRHTHVLYEMRCRACAEIIQLREVSNGFAVVGRGSVSNAVDRAAAVEAIERRFERDDER